MRNIATPAVSPSPVTRAAVLEPQPADLRRGAKVRLLRAAKCQEKEQTPCYKCAGVGLWVNPREPDDKRTCFSCAGTGKVTGGKVKGEDGKISWRRFDAGTVGTVLDWHSFGRFYRNGYNRPDRSNTTVKVRLEDGSEANWSLGAVRLDHDPVELA